VENTQEYYEHAERLGKKVTVGDAKWPEGGFTEDMYIGYCAVILFMGLIHVPAMEFYWNTDDRAQFKMLRSIMPRELLQLFRTVLILLTNITVPT
jgi:hypothetical protein